MRLNKYIAHNTKYSRRDADKLIEAGEVTLNKRPIREFGYEVQPGDRIFVKGRMVKEKGNEVTVIVYNKPKGVLVTKKDDRGRATIYHKLPGKFRHFTPVGRLDYASEGLLLLTDNVEVATALMESKLDRTYNIKIDKPLTQEMIDAMRRGWYSRMPVPELMKRVRSLRWSLHLLSALRYAQKGKALPSCVSPSTKGKTVN